MAIGTTVQADTITDSGLVYVTDHLELMHIAHDCGVAEYDDVSGAFVVVDNGDYAKVWVTYSSRPYDAAAPYTRVR